MINEKQMIFCEYYVQNGWKPVEAYIKAFKCKKESAKVSAYRLLQKPYIQDYITGIEGNYKVVGQGFGMDKQFILKKLKSLMESKKTVYFKGLELEQTEDTSAQNTAITTFLKMTGDLSPEKIELSTEEKAIDISKFSPEELEAFKKKLLKDL